MLTIIKKHRTWAFESTFYHGECEV